MQVRFSRLGRNNSGNAMKKYRIYLDIISAIIASIICWWAFSIASSKFELIIIAGLVYIYANVVFIRAGLSSIVTSNIRIVLQAILRIKPDDDDLINATKELNTQSKVLFPKYFVATGKYIVLELIVIWKLVEEFIFK